MRGKRMKRPDTKSDLRHRISQVRGVLRDLCRERLCERNHAKIARCVAHLKALQDRLLAVVEPDKPALWTVSVCGCARCGDDHHHMRLYGMTTTTGWCPNTGEQVRVQLNDVAQAA